MGVSEPKSPPASFLLPFTPSRLFFSTAFNIFNTLLSLSLLSSRSQRKLCAVVLKSQFSLLSFSCTSCPTLSSCQESFQLSARFPPRGPGLRARRAGHSAAAAPAAPEPGSRSCHRGGSAPARPRASLGPHRDLIGSASPRPCACSGRHLLSTRPPGLRLARPSRPELPGL